MLDDDLWQEEKTRNRAFLCPRANKGYLQASQSGANHKQTRVELAAKQTDVELTVKKQSRATTIAASKA